MFEQNMLVAVMDTEAGRHAARQAVQLAASTGSSLSAVSVVPSLEGDVDRLHVGNVMEVMEASHKQVLEETVTAAQAMGLSIRTFMRHGQPHEMIVDQAESLEAGLVIMGESRRKVLERALIGPTAARVVGYCRTDVLVIPAGMDLDFDKVLVALDGSENSAPAAARALELAEQYRSRLMALSVLQMYPENSILDTYVNTLIAKANDVVNDFKKLAEKKGHTATGKTTQGEDVAAAIVQQASEWGAGLIVMGSHGRTGLRRLLMGSVAESVLAQAYCPVLIVH